jgi:hypothetical protein
METPTPLPDESPSFPQHPTTPDLLTEEPGTAHTGSLNDFHYFLKEKLPLYGGKLKDILRLLFGKYIDFMKSGLISFKQDPPLKKLKIIAVGISPVIILALLAIWIVSLSASKDYIRKEVTKANKDGISIGAEGLEPEYKNKYRKALQYIEQGEYPKARLIIVEFEKINKLETKVAGLKEKLFAGYLAVAKTYFDSGFLLRAKDTLGLAKKIKITDDLLKLEKDIDAALIKSKLDKLGLGK